MSTFPLLGTKSEGNKMASLFEIAVALSKPAFSPLPIKIIIHKGAENVASKPLLHVLTSTEIHLTPVSQAVGLNLRVLGTLTRELIISLQRCDTAYRNISAKTNFSTPTPFPPRHESEATGRKTRSRAPRTKNGN